MRKTQKSALLKALLPKQGMVESLSSYNTTIIDGGALLHRVRWVKNYTFSKVAALYHQYVCDHYNNPEIVFDGYKKSTTKNQEDIRRSLFSLNKITLCRAAYYRQLESIVEGRPAGDTPLVLGDFNVQVGSS